MNYPLISEYVEAIKAAELHAVKCFSRDQEARTEVYLQISEELEYIAW